MAVQPDDITQLRINVEPMRQCLQANDFERITRLDFDFHIHIIAMSGNRAVADIFLGISDVILESQPLPFYQRGGWQVIVAEHTTIIDALEQGWPGRPQRNMCAMPPNARVYIPRRKLKFYIESLDEII